MAPSVADTLYHTRQLSAKIHEIDEQLKKEQRKIENFNKILNIVAAIFHILLTSIPIILAVAVPPAIPICIPMAALCIGLAAWHVTKQPPSRYRDPNLEEKISILKAQKLGLNTQMLSH
jgi:hypothetical protein